MSPPSAQPCRPSRDAALVALAAVVAVLLAGWYLDPTRGHTWFRCPFRALTGLFCPLCGATRGVHLLLHGHLAAAARHNLLVVAAAPWVVWSVSAFQAHAWAGWRWPALGLTRRLAWGLMVAVVVFWVLRNLPGWPWTQLAPPTGPWPG